MELTLELPGIVTFNTVPHLLYVGVTKKYNQESYHTFSN